MKSKLLVVIAVFLMLGAALAAVHGIPAYAAQEGARAHIPLPWNQPPPEFKEVKRKGFHAGVQAAIKDFDHHRDPDYERHKQYVHPKVHRSLMSDYRIGFRRGYDDAMKHLKKSNGRHS